MQTQDMALDRDGIAKETLKLQQQGRRMGLENQPPSNAIEPCEIEHRCKNYFGRCGLRLFMLFLSCVQAVEQKISPLLDMLDPSRFKEFKDKADQAICELQAQMRPEIRTAAAWARKCQRELSSFKDQGYDLSDLSIGSYLYIYGALLAFLIVESLANAYFISLGSALGLLGGAIGAFFIAALSVVLSFTAGVGVNALWGSGLKRKIPAFFLAIVFASGLVVYHLTIGWYRSALVYGNPETAVVDALANLSVHKFNLPDIYSYGLAIIGLFFAGTAFVAGLHSKTARLKAKMARKVKQKDDAENRYRGAVQGYTNGVVFVYTNILDEISEKEKSIVNDAHILRCMLSETDKDKKEIDCMISELRDAYRYAVDLFRGSNQAVRDTSPPKYFVKEPLPLDIEDLKINSSIIEKARSISVNLEDHLMELRKVANSEKGILRNKYGKALKDAAAFVEAIYEDAVNDSLLSVECGDGNMGTADKPQCRIHGDGSEMEASHAQA